MTNMINKIIIGQILGDGHIEKVRKNCRISFSFGQHYLDYANWINSIFKDYCTNDVYSVQSTAKNKEYTNYRLKTRTTNEFTQFHEVFYKFNEKTNKYYKVVPKDIVVCEVVLSHFIIGDGNFSKDKRVRIFTNNYTFEECIILSESIKKHCDVKCEVIFDRISKTKGNPQYILTIGSTQLNKLQSKIIPYIHKSIYYRVGLV